jgi:hypothetical protein
MELDIRERKLLEYALACAASQLEDTLLDTCADQEYRLCLIELGIN